MIREFNNTILNLQNISKSYGKVQALKNISFSVDHSEIIGLLGPNGAGKSTLAKIIVTLLRPSRGEGSINGFQILSDIRKIRAVVGYVPATPILYPHLTALENLLLFSSLYRIPKKAALKKIEELLVSFELWEWRNVPTKRFSSGMIQKVNISRGLLHEPLLLMLDEPFNGLDPFSRITVKNYLNNLLKKGTTVLLTTHFMDSVEDFLQKVIILNHGEMLCFKEMYKLKQDYLTERNTLLFEIKGVLKPEFSQLPQRTRFFHLLESKGTDFFVFQVDSYERSEEFEETVKSFFSKISYLKLKEPTLEEIFVSLTKTKKSAEVHV